MATPSTNHPTKTRLAVIMDPIEAIHPEKDTTLALLLEAQKRGYSLTYARGQDLWAEAGTARIAGQKLWVRDDSQRWFELGERRSETLNNFDVVLMRKDPPFDPEYIYLTYLLELAETTGTRVINRPRALRDYNEKAAILKFPELAPPTIVVRELGILREFHRREGHIVLKPLDGMGGHGVFVLTTEDSNLGSAFEMLSDGGRVHLMAQRYLPAIREGDKRVLLVAGRPVPYMLARLPREGESRANLAAGGHGEPRPLGAAERRIAEVVGPQLAAAGLSFVGIDIIGEHLTEINVTSPTCVRELDHAYGLNIAGELFDAIDAAPPRSLPP